MQKSQIAGLTYRSKENKDALADFQGGKEKQRKGV